MGYVIEVCSTITYIEQRIKSEIQYKELEKAVGYSYRHIREVFKEVTNISLSRFIMSRKISNIAFEMGHTNKSITELAYEYGFKNLDTFTRAFKRETGMTPSDFRKSDSVCGRRVICIGIYGPSILKINNADFTLPKILEVDQMNNAVKTSYSCILYGVQKVYYGLNYQCTPFPMCLQSVLSYMGQDIFYGYLMAASGASFRLRWNVNGWDLGAVDICNIYDQPLKSFELSFKAAGRSYKILQKENSSKEEFTALIKEELEAGRPLIALGVIGPPEACIITGYRDKGETLLGWSFFQENTEYTNGATKDDSGYFVCDSWWENTEAVMAVGEEVKETTPIVDLLENALQVLTREKIHTCEGKSETYYGGQAAFEAWANAMDLDSNFPKEGVLPVLMERMMCFGDVMTMVGEGRSFGGGYMEWLAENIPPVATEAAECAKLLRSVAACVSEMVDISEGYIQGEEQARQLAERSERDRIIKLIKKAQNLELEASKVLEQIIKMLKS